MAMILAILEMLIWSIFWPTLHANNLCDEDEMDQYNHILRGLEDIGEGEEKGGGNWMGEGGRELTLTMWYTCGEGEPIRPNPNPIPNPNYEADKVSIGKQG